MPFDELRRPPVRLRPRPDGDADRVHALHGRGALRPLERVLRAPDLRTVLQHRVRARRRPRARARSGPFNPRLVAGTTNPLAGALQRLPPEARPRRRRPVPRRPQLQDAARASPATCAGSPTARRRRSPPPRRSSGRAEQAAPSCPAASARSAPRTSPPGPGCHPFHAVGKMYLAGPLKGAPLSLVAITPALAGPLRLRRRRRPGRAPRRPADRAGHRGLRHGAADHRRRPDPDALDPGQHRPAELHDQPDQLLALHGRLARGSATRAR